LTTLDYLFVKYEPNPLEIPLKIAIIIFTMAMVGPLQPNPENEIKGNNPQ
jgi:hypothetical protein